MILLLASALPLWSTGFAAAPTGAPVSAGLSNFGRYTNPSPHKVQIALLDTAEGTMGAVQLSVLLESIQRRTLEQRMGLKLEVVNVSHADVTHIKNSVLYYRPGFLRPALVIADIIPGPQSVEPMHPEYLRKQNIDIQIMVGKELP